jgi:sortase A
VSDLELTATALGGGIPSRGHRTPRSARALRAMAVTLIAIGSLALLDALVTMLWQEPVTALYALLEQEGLSGDLSRVEHAAPTAVERRTLASLADERSRIAYLAREAERHTGNGSPIGRILIPQIGASYIVIDGTDTDDLIKGPGLYKETRFPGIVGTSAIAGHRTTYLAPFREINSLRPGNHILLNMPYAHFTYTVTGQRVVLPSDVSAATSQVVGYSRLVLSACTPLFSAEKRLLVYARLTRTVPEGAARALPGGALARPIEPQPRGGRTRRERELLERVLVSLDPHHFTPLV